MDVIGRKIARLNGLSKYFTGKPCVNGHVTYRYVKSGSCEACVNVKSPNNSPSINLRKDALKIMNDARLECAKLASKFSSDLKEIDALEKAERIRLGRECDDRVASIKAATVKAIEEFRQSIADARESMRDAMTKAQSEITDSAAKVTHEMLSKSLSLDAAYMAESQEQQRVLADFSAVRIRPISGDVDGAKSKILAFAKARCTSLTIDDIWNDKQVPDWGGQVYRCLAHKDDIDTIVKLFKTW